MPSAAPATLQAYLTERWTTLLEEAGQRALTVPFYAAMSPEDRAVAMKNILGLFLDALEDRPESATLERARGMIAMRARQGLPLQQSMRGVSNTRALLLRHAREAARLGVEDAWEGALKLSARADELADLFVSFFDELIAETQRALRESEENYRQVVDYSPIGIGVNTLDGTMVYMNDAGARILGLPDPAAVLGTQVMDYVHPDDLEIVNRRRERIGPSYDVLGLREGKLVRRDGAPVDAVIGGRRTTFQGSPANQFVFFDITEQKRSSEALRRSAAQEEALEAQEELLRALSTPLIPLGEGVVVMPLIGRINRDRAAQILEALAGGVVAQQASLAIVDVTGVPEADAEVAAALVRAAQAVRLLGADVMLTGVQPAFARALVELGADLGGLFLQGTLRDGVRAAIARSEARAAAGRARRR